MNASSTQHEDRSRLPSAGVRSRVTSAIAIVSVTTAGAAIVAMALVMLIEAAMRYIFSEPLGWNVSAIERIFLPMTVFLVLPWLYVTAGHVSAEIVYSRMAARWRTGARCLGHLLLLIVAAIMVYAGMITVVDSFVLGDAPPPGSSDVRIPSWIWQLSQPLGAAGLFMVALLDTPRILTHDQALVTTDTAYRVDTESFSRTATERGDEGGARR